MPLLTTITPYWNRPESLRTWLLAIRGAVSPEVRHIIYFVGEPIPNWFVQEVGDAPIFPIGIPEAPGKSIGQYHNQGAKAANTDWIMKLDIDAIPNRRYFEELVGVIRRARPREWFNGGMLYISRASSSANLDMGRMPLTSENYTRITLSPRTHAHGSFAKPEASNFICRRLEYLQLGGSDPRFSQWGWEDYQQLYMLECHWRQSDPLPGMLDISNVTQRCRDEIGRPKAADLFMRNKWLCLLHRWHAPNSDTTYRSKSEDNRQVLLDYILKLRTQCAKLKI